MKRQSSSKKAPLKIQVTLVSSKLNSIYHTGIAQTKQVEPKDQ